MEQREEGNEHRQCGFHGERTGRCQDVAIENSRFCFWHDPDVDKSLPDVGKRLEVRARTHKPMEGFQLKGASLDGVNLVNSDDVGFQLLSSDLRRCSLKGAHLFRLDLSGSNLLKADLARANLHRSNLTGCNLLGVNLKAVRLEHVQFGQQLYQEKEGLKSDREGDKKKAIEWFEEAEEVARNLRKRYEQQGLFYDAGDFFYKEMVMSRHQMPNWSSDRFISNLVNLLSGYGEKPRRIIAFSMLFTLLCSLFYFLFGIEAGGILVKFQPDGSVTQNITQWLETLYFSVVTFTTLGYGDLVPIGLSRVVAALEAFTGSFTMALFVVVFVKKMTR